MDRKCEHCDAVMKPLFMTLYCPNSCEKIVKLQVIQFLWKGEYWKGLLIPRSSIFPQWATHAWEIRLPFDINDFVSDREYSGDSAPGWKIPRVDPSGLSSPSYITFAVGKR